MWGHKLLMCERWGHEGHGAWVRGGVLSPTTQQRHRGCGDLRSAALCFSLWYQACSWKASSGCLGCALFCSISAFGSTASPHPEDAFYCLREFFSIFFSIVAHLLILPFHIVCTHISFLPDIHKNRSLQAISLLSVGPYL